jgi:hypothetical protein
MTEISTDDPVVSQGQGDLADFAKSPSGWPYTLPPGDRRHHTMKGYDHYKCRCPGCQDALTEYLGKWREQNGRRRASSKAVVWVRTNHPEVWKELLNEAYERSGATAVEEEMWIP